MGMIYFKVTTKETGAAGALRMHKTPDTSEDSVIASVPHDAIVQGNGVTVVTNGMRYISYNGTWGWVSDSYLTQCDEAGNTSVYDRQTNVVPNVDQSDNSTTTVTSSKKVDGKKWLIIGGVALAVGAMMNVFM